ncbi:DUF2225 domain-containing protein [Treponema pedis]|uniref:DUF2225 domain-containing protein n=4 Tax=Treponema pedis TaxID=409322 RepID=S5ZZB8_9SPIR|nr:DUF2225 domain-containing protein [Treponema pedis]AGT43573.1 hypothetical protein TPE_1077 [Treponema pedis str. T A4]
MLGRKHSEKETKTGSITFYSKEQIECPVCHTKFKREELHSGGGRLIAGDLTDELRRLYEPSAKYGEVYPAIYNLTVCPKCLFTAFPQDFNIPSKPVIEKLFDEMEARYTSIKRLFHNVDFSKSRGLNEGAASYYLAILCYELFEEKFSPTIKQAISSIRAAWLFDDLGKKYPEENYKYVSDVFYRKATFLYRRALELESGGKEIIAGLKSFGPDVDKNYGYDGIIYLCALLEYKYGQKTDMEARLKRMEYQKFALAKMFGLGKSSKSKPGPLLEAARDLYDALKVELKETDEE